MQVEQIAPRFFITHAHHDDAFVLKLCTDLRAAGLDGFFDVYSIRAGDDIAGRIGRGLEECDVYVPVLSPAALSSPWCEREINAAINLSMERDRGGRPRIIPVIAEECAIPVLLRSLFYINFVGRYNDALQEILTQGFGLSLRPSSAPVLSVWKLSRSVLFGSSSQVWIWYSIIAGVGVVSFLALSVFVMRIAGLAPIIVPETATYVALLTTTGTLPAGTAVPKLPTADLIASPPGSATPISPYTDAPTPTNVPTRVPTPSVVMVYVPAGDFLMGSKDSDSEALSDQKPQHTVYLDAFWIDKFEVTNTEYEKCVDAGKCMEPGDSNSVTRRSYYGNAQFNDYPVVNIRWNNAKGFCEWVGKRLPTEAEWEKAARGVDGWVFPWGNIFDGTKLNSQDSIPPARDTTAVGSYVGGASPYGAMDMAGNVWEWVADWYDPNYYSISPRNNPKGPSSGEYRILRGGSWLDYAGGVRTTYRLKYFASSVIFNVGFRCAQ